MAFPNVLSLEARRRIVDEISQHGDLFSRAKERITLLGGEIVEQGMDTLYFEDLHRVPCSLDAVVHLVVEEFDVLYQRMAEIDGNFYNPTTQSIGLHNYWDGSVGITPHQDFPEDRNLIASFVLEGLSNFGAAMNRQKDGEELFELDAGALILMRAPREGDGKEFRAWHYVLPVIGGRKTLLLRKKDALVKSRASMVRYS